MAKTTETTATAPTYEDDIFYKMRVTRPVDVGPIKYLPRDETRAKGRTVKKIIQLHGESAIDYADPV
ncbi:hypothetical protein [Pannonibacter sp. P2PFMT1]|uniref:hypothetical protein n=1 Tax=Pannonibacter sp. P2PFMT1 TaxID=2003582 RepID=UPI0016443C0B|nr:hypothetical protein [Pannonibacter sp. P2PFMT1]